MALPTTSGGGLTASEVDAAITAAVASWALASGGRIPKTRLPSDTAFTADLYTDADADARIRTEARAGDATRWPRSKLPTDIPATTDIPSDADIDSRADGRVRTLVDSKALSGDATRWGKGKVPSDVVYTDTQRFTAALASQLAALDVRSIDGLAVSGSTLTLSYTDGSGDSQTETATLPSAGTSGLTQAQVDARVRALVEDAAEVANASTRWPKSKLPSDTSYRTDAQVNSLADARIATPARANSPSGRFDKARLPSDTAYGTIPTQSLIEGYADGRIRSLLRSEALAANTDTWPKAKLPSDVAYGAIRTDKEIDDLADARVIAGTAAEARAENAARWPLAKVPQGLATNLAIDGQTLTLERNGAADVDVTLPAPPAAPLADLTLEQVGSDYNWGPSTSWSDTGVAIPDGGLLAIELDASLLDAWEHHVIAVPSLRRLTAGTVGGSPSDPQRISYSSGGLSSIRFGRTAGNNLLVAAGRSDSRAVPVRVYRVRA